MRTLKSIKGIDFLLTLGVLLIASSTIHEYGHLVTLRLLGGKGIIESGILNGVRAHTFILLEICVIVAIGIWWILTPSFT